MRQKEFRIEKLLSARRGVAPETDTVASLKRNIGSLMSDEDGRCLSRAAAELGAAVESMEKAAQAVLAAAESIDDGMRGMSCAQGPDAGCEIAPEMQARIAQIYEACNFQDLAGQRIGKVIDLLGHLEEQLAHVAAGDAHAPATIERRDGGLINGPRLDGASGHVDQRSVDLLFD
ncbi:MAG: protein phosphatase CheZ [Pseudolabrys sp.]